MSKEDDQAKDNVLNIISGESTNKIKFTMGEISVTPAIYGLVVDAIQKGDITVLVLPKRVPPKAIGVYYRQLPLENGDEMYDVLALKKPDFGRTVPELFEAAMGIVHECTHAGLYLARTPNMTHMQHEAAAYIAEGAAGVAEVLSRGGEPASITFDVPLIQMGWDIGLMINKLPSPSSRYWSSPDFAVKWWESINKLYVAITNSDMYSATAKSKVANDGAGHKWKLKSAP
jgi:hypothetical protein